MKPLTPSQLKAMAKGTFKKTAEIGLKHAIANQPFIRKTINDLKNKAHFDQTASIVLSAGPSLHRTDTAQKIVKHGFSGPLVCTDGALGYCLRNGLVPDYLVSVDPHPTRIARWFGDTQLKENAKDDYFRRQDLDPHWIANEEKYNNELIETFNKKGSSIAMIFSTSVSPAVTKRAVEAGAEIYWLNPVYDDYDAPESQTRKLFEMNGAPCLVTGGNVGSLAWVFAAAVLHAKNVALTGMDFGYHPETPLNRTQYYYELKELFGDDYADYYLKVRNPYLKQTWYTDPTYWWYRDVFLKMVQIAPCKTYNCTEGGVLFGKDIHWEKLEKFLKAHPPTSKKGDN